MSGESTEKPRSDLQDKIDRRTQGAWEALGQVLHDGGWEPESAAPSPPAAGHGGGPLSDLAEIIACAHFEGHSSGPCDLTPPALELIAATVAELLGAASAQARVEAWDEGYTAGAVAHCDYDDCDVAGDNPYRAALAGGPDV